MIIDKINIEGVGYLHLTPSKDTILIKDNIESESVYLDLNDSPFNWKEKEVEPNV